MFDVGFFGGKMLPVHLGHVFCIKEAIKQCHELHVILFHSSPLEQKLIATSIFPKRLLQPQIRLQILQDIFQDHKNVVVHSIGAEKCLSGEEIASNKDFTNAEFVTEIIGKKPDVIFSSEPSYSHFFSKLYPYAKHLIIDARRQNFPISGSLLRQLDLENALQFLPKEYENLEQTR